MVRDKARFVVVLPVKSPGTGKSRLISLQPEQRTRLAAAFAADVVTACRSTSTVAAVLVVSDDTRFAATLPGVLISADPGQGLNAALRHGAAAAHHLHPHLQPVALCADLPALTFEDLGTALDLLAQHSGAGFVVDGDGSGTTLYSAPFADFTPRFGVNSAAAHRDTGATPLPGALPTLRRDVDDLDDLAAAVRLGVGDHTAAALSDVVLPAS